MQKTVLITGGAINLGAEIATIFAKNKYNIIINYLTSEEEALILQKNLINDYQVEVMTIKADITKENEVHKMVDKIIKKFNKIDILVNNAAYYKDNFLFDKIAQDFNRILEVNVLGTFLISKEVSKYMLKEKSGNIINIASTNGIDTLNPCSIDYDASKAGVISLTHNLAKELAPYIKVNAIAPGWINTKPVLEMNPNLIKEEQEKILLKRFANPQEIAEVVYFLASEKASYINSSVIRVDGGLK